MKLLSRFLIFALLFFLTVAEVKAQAASPVFQVLTPKEGQILYGNKIPILFKVENIQLVNKDIKEKVTAGEGHILLWLDDENPTAETAAKVTEDSFIYSDVANGSHTLKAQLTTTDNKSLTPPQAITINFNTEAIPSQQQAEISNSFDKTTAVVILFVVALVILAAWWYTKDEEDEADQLETRNTKPKTKKKPVKRGKK